MGLLLMIDVCHFHSYHNPRQQHKSEFLLKIENDFSVSPFYIAHSHKLGERPKDCIDRALALAFHCSILGRF